MSNNLKYLNTQIGFQEIPNEISLEVYISNCQIHCNGCHSPELWQDTGTPLTAQELDNLLDANRGVSCLLLLGGEHDIDALTLLFRHIYGKVKTAWYSGLDSLPEDKQSIIQYLNYIKLGHYDPQLGGLSTPTTNQHLYKIEHQSNINYWLTDITKTLQNPHSPQRPQQPHKKPIKPNKPNKPIKPNNAYYA